MKNRETMSTETRITLLEEQMDRLFGANGKPGLIDEMKEDIREIKDLALKARYVLVGCFGAIILFQMLTGAGTVSLQNLIKALAK
jgi:hypothetical protein